MTTNNILYVEDNEGDIFLLQHAFETAGVTNTLDIVRDGEQAMRYLTESVNPGFRSLPPSLVLLDLNLPRISGLELLKWIRSQTALKAVVVIVFTSSEDARDIRTAYDLGANSYVLKPPDLSARSRLVNIMRAWWLELNKFAESGATGSPLLREHQGPSVRLNA